jgi:hypothetical protein
LRNDAIKVRGNSGPCEPISSETRKEKFVKKDDAFAGIVLEKVHIGW